MGTAIIRGSGSRIDFSDTGDAVTDVGGPAQLRLPRVHSVEQSAISTA